MPVGCSRDSVRRLLMPEGAGARGVGHSLTLTEGTAIAQASGFPRLFAAGKGADEWRSA